MRHVIFSLLLCLLAAQSSRAEEKFADEVLINAGGTPIDVGGFRGAAPFVGDFDGDGLNDLLVGQGDLGRLRIYRNVGTAGEPRFDDFEWFRVNGEIVELPGGGLFRPQLVDLDGDGKLDIVTASGSGMIFWYRRLAGDKFADAEIVRLASGRVLNASAGCHVVDWDQDGDQDLIISGQPNPGVRSTEVWFVENRGPPPSLFLSDPRRIEADGEPIRSAQLEACPFVADWNRDGKHDLLLGLRDGSVVIYENSGQRGAPRLASSRTLVKRPPAGRAEPDADIQRHGSSGGFCVADWHNDGKLDILIADAQRVTVPFDASEMADQLEKTRTEVVDVVREYRRLRGLNNRLQEAQEKQKVLVRQKREQYARRLDELHDAISSLEKAMQPRQESHGYFWLLRTMNPE